LGSIPPRGRPSSVVSLVRKSEGVIPAISARRGFAWLNYGLVPRISAANNPKKEVQLRKCSGYCCVGRRPAAGVPTYFITVLTLLSAIGKGLEFIAFVEITGDPIEIEEMT
jgi:hypothetical protein